MRTLAPRSIALLAITGISVYLCWLMVQPFFKVLIWAAVLAIISYPFHAWFMRRGRGPAAGAALTTLIVVLTLVVPLTFIGLALVHELTVAVPHLQSGIRQLLDRTKLLDPDSPWRQWLDRYVDTSSMLDADFLEGRVKAVSAMIGKEMVGVVGDLFGTALQGFFVLFTLYYMLRDADRILASSRRFLPLDAEQADKILRQTHEVISASLHGVLMIAALQGALGGMAFWVLGLASPLLWGVVMFFMSMIPMAGAFMVWLPAAVYLLATNQPIKAVMLTIWGSLVIGLLDNFLRPRLVGQKTRLHELVVLFSVLGGLKVFGVLGLVVGPVVVAVTMALIDVLRQANEVSPPPNESSEATALAPAAPPTAPAIPAARASPEASG